jgi:hypothetical protein
MARGGKRALVPHAWEELSIETALIEKALRRPITDQDLAGIESVKRQVENAFNMFQHAPLISTVEKERKRLDNALKTIERVLSNLDTEPERLSALARSMRLREDSRTDDAICSLSNVRKLVGDLRERIKYGSLDELSATTTVEPRTFCFRVLLCEIAPFATKWGIPISEKSPRFVDLTYAFGLFDDRKKRSMRSKIIKKRSIYEADKLNFIGN